MLVKQISVTNPATRPFRFVDDDDDEYDVFACSLLNECDQGKPFNVNVE